MVLALRYMWMYGENCIVYLSEVEAQKQAGVGIPFDLQRDLVQCLKTQDEKNMVYVLGEIARALRVTVTDYRYILIYFEQLTGYLLMSLYEMGYNQEDIMGSESVYESIHNRARLEELLDYLKTLCYRVLRFLGERGQERIRAIAHQAMMTIDQRFRDPNFSLTQLSDEYKISPSYMSRVLKEVLDVSFADYITMKRVAYGKQLLIEGKLNLQEISDTLGISVQTFIRSFRRIEGLTPGQYRTTLMEKTEE